MTQVLRLHRNVPPVETLPKPSARTFVVVAVDSSPASERAVRLAIDIARGDENFELIFCHVVDVQRMIAQADGLGDYELAYDVASDNARRLLDSCLAAAADAGVFGRSCLRYGKPAYEIMTLAGLFSTDFVVIGNRPSSRAHRFLNGSVRDEIVRTSSLPVLVASAKEADSAELGSAWVVVSAPTASWRDRVFPNAVERTLQTENAPVLVVRNSALPEKE